jgi:hypothetical protein
VTDGALQLETNAVDHSGGQILTFASGVPLIWSSDMPNANPITTNVTKFYLTNAGSADVILRGYVLNTPA